MEQINSVNKEVSWGFGDFNGFGDIVDSMAICNLGNLDGHKNEVKEEQEKSSDSQELKYTSPCELKEFNESNVGEVNIDENESVKSIEDLQNVEEKGIEIFEKLEENTVDSDTVIEKEESSVENKKEFINNETLESIAKSFASISESFNRIANTLEKFDKLDKLDKLEKLDVESINHFFE